MTIVVIVSGFVHPRIIRFRPPAGVRTLAAPCRRRTQGAIIRRMNAVKFLTLVLLGAALAACAGGNRPLQLVAGAGAIYPPQARAEGIEGYVVVRYDVDAEGRVHNVRVASAAPPDVFDEAAVQAVSRWRFTPAQQHGEPRPVANLESRLEFNLDGAEAYADY
jgi:TonB family protein